MYVKAESMGGVDRTRRYYPDTSIDLRYLKRIVGRTQKNGGMEQAGQYKIANLRGAGRSRHSSATQAAKACEALGHVTTCYQDSLLGRKLLNQLPESLLALGCSFL